jgi:hypothetical protein
MGGELHRAAQPPLFLLPAQRNHCPHRVRTNWVALCQQVIFTTLRWNLKKVDQLSCLNGPGLQHSSSHCCCVLRSNVWCGCLLLVVRHGTDVEYNTIWFTTSRARHTQATVIRQRLWSAQGACHTQATPHPPRCRNTWQRTHAGYILATGSRHLVSCIGKL